MVIASISEKEKGGMRMSKIIKRAAEILRENPTLKYYQAMDQARRETDEVDRKTAPRIFKEER